jgi:hypothetical protein
MTPNQPSLWRLHDEAARLLLRLSATADDVEAIRAKRAPEVSGLELASELARVSETECVDILRRLSK